MSVGKGEYLVEPARRADIPVLIEILREQPPTRWMRKMADLGLKGFLRYSINSSYCHLILARRGDEHAIGGYVISIVHPSRFWWGFVITYPATALFLAIDYAIYRFLKKGSHAAGLNRNSTVSQSEECKEDLPSFSWSPSHPGIARIVYIYVREECRGLGLGKELYTKLFEHLRNKKCSIIEAHIDYQNQPSIKLHQSTGWEIQELKDGDYKAVKYL